MVKKKRNVLKDILIIFQGELILLCGAWIVNLFCSGVLGSIITIIPLIVALHFIARKMGLDIIIGRGTVQKSLFISALIAIGAILFSTIFVFNDYLNGNSMVVSAHPEHALAFQNLEELTEMIRNGQDISDQINKGLRLEQYFYLFTYSSVMFLFGGTNVTHICIWNTFHSYLIGVLTILISEQCDNQETDSTHIRFLSVLSLPYFLAVFVYHRDIVAMAVIMLALYVYISTYQSPLVNLLAFPIYAFLLYAARYQYIAIAFVLLLYAAFCPNSNYKKQREFVFFQLLAIIVIGVTSVILLPRVLSDAEVLNDLHISNYTKGEYGPLGWIKRLVLSFAGNFPWTNMIGNRDWTYLLFLTPQGWVNTAYFMIIIRQIVERRSKITDIFVLLYMIMYIFGFGGSVHVSYIAISAPIAILAMDDISLYRKRNTVFACAVFFLITGVLYNAMGLTGSGFIGLNQ